MNRPFLIAQITDLHLGTEPISALNADRLRRVVARVVEVAPDLIIASGDLTESGDEGSYIQLKRLMEPLQAPILYALGNHDLRPGFCSVFPETPSTDGFLQHEWTSQERRVLVLDTLEDGRHGGAFCERRQAWLKARLAEDPAMPTLIVMHHPPARSGIEWMDTDADGEWSKRLDDALRGQTQVVGLLAGHLHRAVSMSFAGHRLTVAPSVAPQVALELDPISASRPDRRPLIVEENPGYALHLWGDDGLISHFGSVGDDAVLARFDNKTRGMIEDMTEETV